MLTGIHFLLTYKCNMECDHCFVYSAPSSRGTFTLDQLRKVFSEIEKIGTIEQVYFEGGEPFMFYPLMLEGIKLAAAQDLEIGIVTNSYWATSDEDAELWLKPLEGMKLVDLSVSDDTFHYGEDEPNPTRFVEVAAEKLGIPVGSICIDKPSVQAGDESTKGQPYITGGALLKGRAVEKLMEGLPLTSYDKFTDCLVEDLRNPGRVHVDSYGYVHLCQGLVIGNMWETPLSELVTKYNADDHPICKPLVEGGPVQLAKEFDVTPDDKYATACHFCYEVRMKLLDKFPQFLAPKQVYGIE
ncbi:MAG: radical SAM protein [Thermoplasmata archaeon]|nr:MAG: radical SAM protein [Thermoplasmata archaeon]